MVKKTIAVKTKLSAPPQTGAQRPDSFVSPFWGQTLYPPRNTPSGAFRFMPMVVTIFKISTLKNSRHYNPSGKLSAIGVGALYSRHFKSVRRLSGYRLLSLQIIKESIFVTFRRCSKIHILEDLRNVVKIDSSIIYCERKQYPENLRTSFKVTPC